MIAINLSTRAKVTFGVALLLLAAGSVWLRSAMIRSKQHSLYESCANHVAFIEYEFLKHIPAGDKREDSTNGTTGILHLPFDPSLPGYALFAKNTSGGIGGVNCNHGAPHCSFGGWQALNLPEETLKKLQEVWWRKYQAMPENETKWHMMGGGMPYAWCGEPPGGGFRRICVTLGGGLGPAGWEWHLDRDEIQDGAIDLLNECLKSIGEKEIPINVPEGIDWMKYLSPAKEP